MHLDIGNVLTQTSIVEVGTAMAHHVQIHI